MKMNPKKNPEKGKDKNIIKLDSSLGDCSFAFFFFFFMSSSYVNFHRNAIKKCSKKLENSAWGNGKKLGAPSSLVFGCLSRCRLVVVVSIHSRLSTLWPPSGNEHGDLFLIALRIRSLCVKMPI